MNAPPWPNWSDPPPRESGPSGPPSEFATTRWSVVLAAGREGSTGDAARALQQLCRDYWYPLYAYIRRKVGDQERARDLTQDFFAEMLAKNFIGGADPQRGRFRAYLLTACQRFLVDQWHRDRAQKRGGGRKILSLDLFEAESRYAGQAVESITAERLFDQQWALTLLGHVIERLGAEQASAGRQDVFERLKPFLSRHPDRGEYAQAAQDLALTPAAVKVAVHRLRRRFRELLEAEIGGTVANPAEVDDEICRLFEALSP